MLDFIPGFLLSLRHHDVIMVCNHRNFLFVPSIRRGRLLLAEPALSLHCVCVCVLVSEWQGFQHGTTFNRKRGGARDRLQRSWFIWQAVSPTTLSNDWMRRMTSIETSKTTTQRLCHFWRFLCSWACDRWRGIPPHSCRRCYLSSGMCQVCVLL